MNFSGKSSDEQLIASASRRILCSPRSALAAALLTLTTVGLLATTRAAAAPELRADQEDASNPTGPQVGPYHAMESPLMPQPAKLTFGNGTFVVSTQVASVIHGHDDGPLRAALNRMLTQWELRSGLTFAHTPTGEFQVSSAFPPKTPAIVIEVRLAGPSVPTLGEDESYSLEITPAQAALRSATTTGALRGLATLTQLLQSNESGWFLPVATIDDRPRFFWRGLLIDVCRHWQPIDVIKRNLDGMALVKLNVLHLHLTEDQGFRIESKRFPQLQQKGSDGHYFTQAQMREIVAYAAQRGIRVVPEFDIPGHATSWVVAFPELASTPGPYSIERRWGVFDPVLDPTNEKTYELLDGFLGEMADLFPDPYIHIGGDENNGGQWNANDRIQAFIRERGLKSNAGLHAYFNQRVREILAKHGKKMIGWDEILHPGLPKDSVIQSWRGAEGLADATSSGYQAILSNGYYIDLCHPAAEHYRNDPIPTATKLTREQQSRILGGEATMWSEWVTPETIDSRIWPRTAAIAERLWSPRDVNSVADMYRRLSLISHRLEEAGLLQNKNRGAMIRRFAGDGASEELLRSLAVLIEAVEPVKDYNRSKEEPGSTQFTPLTGLADCARPESDSAREFRIDMDDLLRGTTNELSRTAEAMRNILSRWQAAGDFIATSHEGSPRVTSEAVPVAAALADTAAIGLAALRDLEANRPVDDTWRTAALDRLDTDAKIHAAVELPMIAAIRQLLTAAAPSKTP